MDESIENNNNLLEFNDLTDISGINFKTESSFNLSAVIICIILTITYFLLW